MEQFIVETFSESGDRNFYFLQGEVNEESVEKYINKYGNDPGYENIEVMFKFADFITILPDGEIASLFHITGHHFWFSNEYWALDKQSAIDAFNIEFPKNSGNHIVNEIIGGHWIRV